MSVIDYGIATGTWRSDKIHSDVSFGVRYLGVSVFRGKFSDFAVTLEAGDAEPRLEGTVEVASIAVDEPSLAAHLQSPEFFDVERTPQLRFESSRFKREGDTVEVAGELTIRDVARPVVARGEITEVLEDADGNERIGLQLTTKIDRREFGLNWNRDMPRGGKALANEVTLSVDLSLVKT